METQTFKLFELIEKKNLVIEQGISGKLHAKTTLQLILLSATAIAIFGFILGCNHSIAQAFITAVKLPIIFLLTAAICYPTLYLFLSLLGLGYSLKQLAHFLLLCIALNSVILIAFAPISTFFLITNSGYGVFKMVNVGIMAIGGFTGLYIFKKYLFIKAPEDWNHKYRHRAKTFVSLWLLMYGMIGANLGFYLSPVFGIPGKAIMFITDSSENFFSHLLHFITTL